MKKIMLATFGIIGIIGVTAGVLLTRKAVPLRSEDLKGKVQGTTTGEMKDSSENAESTVIPGDFPDANSVTPSNDAPTQTMEDAPTQPSSDADLKKSLDNMQSELHSVTPSTNDVDGI